MGHQPTCGQIELKGCCNRGKCRVRAGLHVLLGSGWSVSTPAVPRLLPSTRQPLTTWSNCSCISRYELERDTIVAVTQSRWFGSIIEHMAVMAATAGAMVFCTGPDEFEILPGFQRAG